MQVEYGSSPTKTSKKSESRVSLFSGSSEQVSHDRGASSIFPPSPQARAWHLEGSQCGTEVTGSWEEWTDWRAHLGPSLDSQK